MDCRKVLEKINCPLEIRSSPGFQDLLLNLRVSPRLPAQGAFSPCSFCEQSILRAFARQRYRLLQTACGELGFLQKQGSLQSERVLLDEATLEKTSQQSRTPLDLTCKRKSQHLPPAWQQGAWSQVSGSGSLRGAAVQAQRAPPTVGMWLLLGGVRGVVGAVVLVFGGPLGLHRHDEGLALRQKGPALGHEGLCPIQHYSYGMIWKAHAQQKLNHHQEVTALQS